MAVVYNNTVKDARLTVVLNAIDTDAPGSLELQAANDDVLAIFTLEDPAGAVASQALTFDTPLSTTGEAAASTGTNATKARIKDGNGVVIVDGLTVGLSASDIIIDNQSIAEDQTVNLTSAVINHG